MIAAYSSKKDLQVILVLDYIVVFLCGNAYIGCRTPHHIGSKSEKKAKMRKVCFKVWNDGTGKRKNPNHADAPCLLHQDGIGWLKFGCDSVSWDSRLGYYPERFWVWRRADSQHYPTSDDLNKISYSSTSHLPLQVLIMKLAGANVWAISDTDYDRDKSFSKLFLLSSIVFPFMPEISNFLCCCATADIDDKGVFTLSTFRPQWKKLVERSPGVVADNVALKKKNVPRLNMNE
ncbi:hypothetical protein BDZ45DRAFT_742146 [Acephala macrosclerotiorum]|nr:hypothetical protein BDZ45DRAFT_742146 [Acephala macrosclerotiorum]